MSSQQIPLSIWLPKALRRRFGLSVGASSGRSARGLPAPCDTAESGAESGTKSGAEFGPKSGAAGAALHRIAPGEIFTPTRPRTGRRTLVGRNAELARVLEAIGEEAAHVVIYAERGRGKTSLTNLAIERLRRSGTIVGRFVCNAESRFDQIMHGLVRDLPSALLAIDGVDSDASARRGCDHILPQADVSPADVAAIVDRLSCKRLVFVVDEFDRVRDQTTRTQLADTIKLLSDRDLKLLFMIVGVSTTLEQIIGQHPSIQRNVIGVHLPLLPDCEIIALLKRGGEAAGLLFTDDTCDIVAGVARGMPHMAQLMGLRIAQHAIARGATETERQDVGAAIGRLIHDQAPEIVARYTKLTRGPDGRAMKTVLNAAARCPQDRWANINLSTVEARFVTQLLDAKVYESSPASPDLLQPVDRPLIYLVLLLAALDDLTSASIVGLGPASAERRLENVIHGH